jgi:hypothetical protein
MPNIEALKSRGDDYMRELDVAEILTRMAEAQEDAVQKEADEAGCAIEILEYIHCLDRNNDKDNE